MTGPSQRDRVLAALAHAGANGLTQADWLRWPTPDQGAPITRLAARIDELRDMGVPVVNHGRRDKCVVYVLRSHLPAGAGIAVRNEHDGDQGEPSSPSPHPASAGSLFDLDEIRPRNALLGDEDAA